VVLAGLSQPVMSTAVDISKLQAYLFGNPSVRAISKLTSRIMQVTLKVKSVQSLGASSPTLTFLSGSLLWVAQLYIFI
jgi:hypothetical protein